MNSIAENPHTSVLFRESLELLAPLDKGWFVDATLGAAGHAAGILKASESIKLIGFDQDPDALKIAADNLKEFESRVELIHANFESVAERVEKLGIEGVEGIIADLGVSSMQFDRPDRGFSFRFDTPLDMRMNPSEDSPTAAELLETLSEEEIANAIYQFGEERFSRRIARNIVKLRSSGTPVQTTGELASLVKRSVPGKWKHHPATKTFQALRILVNRELEVLERFIEDAIELLNPGGRIAIISFHSLEDRIVKRSFQKFSGRCFCPKGFPKCVCGSSKKVKILTKKPITPTPQEIETNPRSRSARLRAASRLDPV